MDKDYLDEVASEISSDIDNLISSVDDLKTTHLGSVEADINDIVDSLNELSKRFVNFAHSALAMIPDEEE